MLQQAPVRQIKSRRTFPMEPKNANDTALIDCAKKAVCIDPMRQQGKCAMSSAQRRGQLGAKSLPVQFGGAVTLVAGYVVENLDSGHVVSIGYTTIVSKSNKRWSKVKSGLHKHPLVFSLIGTFLTLVLIAGTVLIVGNTFAIRTERVHIPVSEGELDAVLAWPKDVKSPVGVVVFVHGDGPVDATNDGFYQPIWEALAKAGYASLSWSKAGIGGSSGAWLNQSLDDRATDVEEAIAWVRTQPGIDPHRIGLWGASQGGWVVPKVATHTKISFAILVSPAINWISQGRFDTVAAMKERGAPQSEQEKALASFDQSVELLKANATYATYLATTTDTPPMTEDRWGFVLRNFRADATADLAAMARAKVPTLLILGANDLNVDALETERVYRAQLGSLVEVHKFTNARHTLARKSVQDSDTLGLVVSVFAPRQIFAPGYLDTQRLFAAAQVVRN